MKRLATIYMMFLMLLSSGCSLDIKLEDQFSDPDAITTIDAARELLASAYNSLPRHQVDFSLLSDDLVPTNLSSKYAEMINLYNWQEKAMVTLSSNVWNEYYMTIAIINALLSRLNDVKTDDELELEKVRSEAKALKAMCYLDLLRLYGPVWSEENAQKDCIVLKNRLELDFLPRSTMEKCIEEVRTLLSEALQVENEATSIFYLSTTAVKALQVELALWCGQYDVVIETGLPLLEGSENRWTKSSIDNLWSDSASEERIFAPYIFDSFYTDLCYDRADGDYFALNQEIRFDDTDIRCSWYVYPFMMSSGETNLVGKYNKMYYESRTVRYINTIRYSSVCFAVAEAYARSADGDEQAVEIVNSYLGACGAALIDKSLKGDALVERILQEKRKETIGEGTRLFDLKRTGAYLQRFSASGAQTSTIRKDDYRWLFPIPEAEYKYNDKMTQNPQWPFIKAE